MAGIRKWREKTNGDKRTNSWSHIPLVIERTSQSGDKNDAITVRVQVSSINSQT